MWNISWIDPKETPIQVNAWHIKVENVKKNVALKPAGLFLYANEQS